MNGNKNKASDSQSLRKDIGKFIRESRISKSLTGSQLGELLDVSQQQVSRYENGITSISIETLDTILQMLDLEWSDFYREVLVIDVTNYTSRNEVIMIDAKKYTSINKESFPFYLHI